MRWTYRWSDKPRPHPTGMIWRKGVLWYKRPIGPVTYFNHILLKNLSMMYMSQLKFLPGTPLMVSGKTPIPEFTGSKTIQFFTCAPKGGSNDPTETHS